MTQKIQKQSIFFVALFALVCIGCSNDVRVTGTVTFEDGSPLTVGMVNFETDTISMIGPINKDGTYTLTPDGRTNRIPTGTYRVFITGAEVPSGRLAATADPRGGAGGRELPMPIINRSHTSPSTSGWVVTVEGNTVFNITVTPP